MITHHIRRAAFLALSKNVWPASRRPLATSWTRAFSATPSMYMEEAPRAPLERHKFEYQAYLWEQYVETGEGVTELFDSFLMDPSSNNNSKKTISAADFQEFLENIDRKGIGSNEFHELDSRHEMDVKDFRSWARHATHDWSVHV